MMKLVRTLSLFCAVLALSACSALDWFGSEDAPPLEGERISILELQRDLEPDSAALSAQGFIAPPAWRNEFWPQAGGYPNHSMQHLALNSGELEQVWTVSIGRGSSKELPLTAQPIVVDGTIFTLDTRSTLSAFSVKDGERLWHVDVSDPDEDDPVIGGGLSYSKGQLYVTTGYDEVLALSPLDGKLIWRVKIPAPSRAAPTVMEERLFVSLLDNRLLALDVTDGQVLWEHTGISETAGLVGAASPAASRDIVIPAFSSGEIFALRVENGSIAWAENLAAFRSIGGLAGLSDIRGLPVMDKGIVIAISFSGRLLAIDERTGTRIWQREIGGSETPWVAGNHLFVISTENELVALGRDNGVIRWVNELARFEDPDDREDPIYWSGPVLAGGRLIIAGTNGEIVEVTPETGQTIRQWSTDESIAIAPIVTGNTLYLLAEDGTLMAYR